MVRRHVGPSSSCSTTRRSHGRPTRLNGHPRVSVRRADRWLGHREPARQPRDVAAQFISSNVVAANPIDRFDLALENTANPRITRFSRSGAYWFDFDTVRSSASSWRPPRSHSVRQLIHSFSRFRPPACQPRLVIRQSWVLSITRQTATTSMETICDGLR